jgi:hypothetical protein
MTKIKITALTDKASDDEILAKLKKFGVKIKDKPKEGEATQEAVKDRPPRRGRPSLRQGLLPRSSGEGCSRPRRPRKNRKKRDPESKMRRRPKEPARRPRSVEGCQRPGGFKRISPRRNPGRCLKTSTYI